LEGATCARENRQVEVRTGHVSVLAVAIVIGTFAAGCATATDPAAIADAQTVARVKTALVNDPMVGGLPIQVRVTRRVASLSGRVPSPAHLDRAVAIAAAVQGVTAVAPENLRVGAEPSPPPDAPDVPAAAPLLREFDDPGSAEIDPAPGLLAVGGSIGWSLPGPEALKARFTVSPLVKLGSPGGLGPVVAFDWFQADLQSIGGAATLTRVHVRPVMGGVAYTFAATRFSFAPSIVGGYSFNSLTVTDTGGAEGLPVEVRNGPVWRVGASAWYDISRRVAVNASTGYLRTGLRLTVLEGGRLVRRDARGDTTLLHLGVAYRLF
jgi:hypothetical protein